MIQVNLIQDQTIQIIFIKHKNIRQLKEKEFLQQTLKIKKFSKNEAVGSRETFLFGEKYFFVF